MLSGAKHLAFSRVAKSRFFGYRLRMTLRHSLRGEDKGRNDWNYLNELNSLLFGARQLHDPGVLLVVFLCRQAQTVRTANCNVFTFSHGILA